MNFNLNFTVQVDMDTNLFQRKDFEKLLSMLRRDSFGYHLEKVDLRKSKMKNIDLSGLDLSNFDFTESVLKNINFSNCNLSKCQFEKATLLSCNFSGVRMEAPASWLELKATDCDFSNALLNGVLKWMQVENCNFENTTFMGLLANVDFTSCKMTNYKTEGQITMSGLTFPE